ncbi:MAG: hypothetical protein FWG64_07905 [Firmicutes bacterium]|nr:hypothetical protein [Bacillota bacterium]
MSTGPTSSWKCRKCGITTGGRTSSEKPSSALSCSKSADKKHDWKRV